MIKKLFLGLFAAFVALIAATTAPDMSRTGAATLHRPLSNCPSCTTVCACRSRLAIASAAVTSRAGLSAINRRMSRSDLWDNNRRPIAVWDAGNRLPTWTSDDKPSVAG